MPQEAGLHERAVSYYKGCYIGQETVARLYWKGKPNRHLRGLRFSAPAPPGAALLLGEQPVGAVASVVARRASARSALALVRREAEPGAVLDVGGAGATAHRTVELPFGSRIARRSERRRSHPLVRDGLPRRAAARRARARLARSSRSATARPATPSTAGATTVTSSCR